MAVKEDEPNIALQIVIIGIFMLAVFAGGFFALRAVQRSRAEVAATAPTVTTLTLPPPPTAVPLPTVPTETIPTAPTATSDGTSPLTSIFVKCVRASFVIRRYSRGCIRTMIPS